MTIFGTQSDGDFAAEVAKAAEAETSQQAAPIEADSTSATGSVTEGEKVGQEVQTQPALTPPTTEHTKEKEPDRFVPLAAMQEERTKRQDAERERDNWREALQQWQKQFQQPQQYEQQPDPLDIDPNAEPFELMNNLRNEVMQWRAQRQAEVETGQLKTAYLGTIQQANAADATFKDAYNHLVQSRMGELVAMGMHPMQANETIKQEELHLARTSFMSGRNPAEVIMGYAKARGFAPKNKQAEPPPATDQVKQQAAKEAAATSISAGGKPPENELSMSDIANLNGAAFDAAWDKLAKKAGKPTSLFRH